MKIFHHTTLLSLFLIGMLIGLVGRTQPKLVGSTYVTSAKTKLSELDDDKFQHFDGASINFGFESPCVWVKLDITHPDDNTTETDYILYSINKITDSISAYIVHNDGAIETKYFGMLINDKSNHVNIKMASSIKTIYLKIISHTFIRDEFYISTNSSYQDGRSLFSIFIGLVFGALFILGTYSLVLFIKLNEKAYLYYSLFVFSLLLLFLYVEGVGSSYIWKSIPSFSLFAEPISTGLAAFGLSFYTHNLLSVKSLNKLLSILLQISGLLGLCLVVFAFILSARTSSQIANVLPLISTLLVTITAVYAFFTKVPYAKHFLFGWMVFLSAGFGRVLYNNGAISYIPFIDVINYLGVLIETVVFVWIISLKMKGQRDQQALYQLKLSQLSTEIDSLKEFVIASKENENQEEISNNSFEEDFQNYLIDPLSDRELDVLKELSSGKTYQQIADALFVSKNTVKSHVLNIYSKLDVSNRTEALNKAKSLKIGKITLSGEDYF